MATNIDDVEVVKVDRRKSSAREWFKGRVLEWSTWRGLMVVGTAVLTALNPAAGLAVGKIIAAVIGSVEVVKPENRA